jgi:hypothetical protein
MTKIKLTLMRNIKLTTELVAAGLVIIIILFLIFGISDLGLIGMATMVAVGIVRAVIIYVRYEPR